MESHPDQAELKPTAGAVPPIGGESAEDDLLDMISSLEERLGDVRELQREQRYLENEFDGFNADLDARAAELEQREQLLGESSTEIRSEREEVDAERRTVAEHQAELERRRQALDAKEREVGDRLSNVDQMQAKLEAAEADLRAEREFREAEADKFRREQAELAERETELAAHAAEAGKDAPEIQALAAQLADAQKLATERTLEAEQRAAEANKRTLELEARCKDLAGECQVVRVELKGSREQMKQVEQDLPKRVYKQRVRAQRTESAQRAIVVTMTWLCVAITMGAAGLAGINGHPGEAVIMLGLTFAAFFFGSHAVAGRLFDAPAIAIGIIGASFGWWFPLWSGAIAQALEVWSLPTGSLSPAVAAQLPLSAAILTSTITLTVGLFALTWSGPLLFQVGFVSMLAGGLALMPDTTGFALGAAAVVWIVVTGTGLTRWACQVASTSSGIGSGSSRSGDNGGKLRRAF